MGSAWYAHKNLCPVDLFLSMSDHWGWGARIVMTTYVSHAKDAPQKKLKLTWPLSPKPNGKNPRTLD